MSKKIGILFVCTGNICRSPTAEGVFRHRVRAEGLENAFLIDSAGIEDYHTGDPPDSRSIKAALKRGVALDELKARKVRATDFHDFDLILAMDKGHHRALKNLKPKDARAEVALFLDFANAEMSRDVPDPYYGGPADFTLVLDLVEEGVDGLLRHLRAEKKI